MADRVLRLPAVLELIGKPSKSWLYDQISKELFPNPIKLGCGDSARSVGWLESEISQYIDQRVEQSRPMTKTEPSLAAAHASTDSQAAPTGEPCRTGRFGRTALHLRQGPAVGRSTNP
jgi:prophage regulatory protein